MIGQVSEILGSHWPRRGHYEQCDITTVAPPQANWGRGRKKDTFVESASQALIQL